MTVNNAIKLTEKSRKYTFPGGDIVELNEVTELAFGSSGTHRIKTADKKLHIIPKGWIHVEIDEENWTI